MADLKFTRKVELDSVAGYSPKNSNSISENRIPYEWLSTKEAAFYLGITVNALHICVHRGQIKVYRFGRRLRFRLEELRSVLLKGAS